MVGNEVIGMQNQSLLIVGSVEGAKFGSVGDCIGDIKFHVGQVAGAVLLPESGEVGLIQGDSAADVDIINDISLSFAGNDGDGTGLQGQTLGRASNVLHGVVQHILTFAGDGKSHAIGIGGVILVGLEGLISSLAAGSRDLTNLGIAAGLVLGEDDGIAVVSGQKVHHLIVGSGDDLIVDLDLGERTGFTEGELGDAVLHSQNCIHGLIEGDGKGCIGGLAFAPLRLDDIVCFLSFMFFND